MEIKREKVQMKPPSNVLSTPKNNGLLFGSKVKKSYSLDKNYSAINLHQFGTIIELVLFLLIFKKNKNDNNQYFHRSSSVYAKLTGEFTVNPCPQNELCKIMQEIYIGFFILTCIFSRFRHSSSS